MRKTHAKTVHNYRKSGVKTAGKHGCYKKTPDSAGVFER